VLGAGLPLPSRWTLASAFRAILFGTADAGQFDLRPGAVLGHQEAAIA